MISKPSEPIAYDSQTRLALEALRDGKQNPFFLDRVVDPFEVDPNFVDIEDFNSDAYGAVVKELEAVERSGGQSRGILVLGEAGSGKTHMLARIRSNLRNQNILLFVPRPTNEESVYSHIWANVFESLSKPGSDNGQTTQGETLLRKSFAEILNRSVAGDADLGAKMRDDYRRFIDKLKSGEATIEDEKRLSARSRIVREFKSKQNITSPWVESFLSAWLNYILYRDKSKRQKVIERLRSFDYEREDGDADDDQAGWAQKPDDNTAHKDLERRREEWAFDGIKVVSRLASYTTPMVLAFDQLEGLRDNLPLTRAWGDALREILDRSMNLVIMVCVFPSLWKNWFTNVELGGIGGGSPLDDSAIQRLAASTLTLRQLTSLQARKLVASRLRQLPGQRPTDIFPFTPADLTAILEANASKGVRRFIQGCAEKFNLILNGDQGSGDANDPLDVMTRFMDRQPKPPNYTEADWIGRLRELAMAILGSELKLQPAMTYEGKVVPSNFCATYSGTQVVIGVCNARSGSFTARLKNWKRAIAANPERVFVLLRSAHTLEPGSDSVAATFLKELPRYRRLSEASEKRFFNLHKLLVALQEGELFADESPLTANAIRDYWNKRGRDECLRELRLAVPLAPPRGTGAVRTPPNANLTIPVEARIESAFPAELVGVDKAGLRRLYREHTLAAAMFDDFAQRQRSQERTTIEQMHRRLSGQRDVQCSESDIRKVFERLEDLHCGELRVGRRGHKTRFYWDYQLNDIGRFAKGNEVEIHPHVAPNEAEDETLALAPDGMLPMSTVPALPVAERAKVLRVTFPLRIDVNLALEIPADITAAELARLSQFLLLLPHG